MRRVRDIRLAAENEKKAPTPPDLSVLSSQPEYCLLRQHSPKLAEDGLEITRNMVLSQWNKGDIEGALCMMDNVSCLIFIRDNAARLIAKNKYEKALLSAYTATRTNFASWDFNEIRLLFELADVNKLRSAGDPIPQQKNFTVYRGVSGHEPQRRVIGYSWTNSPGVAAGFAKRWKELGLEDPAVYEVTVPFDCVLAFYHGRQESEFILRVPLPVKPHRLRSIPKATRPGKQTGASCRENQIG
jgi:hypothetical protein